MMKGFSLEDLEKSDIAKSAGIDNSIPENLKEKAKDLIVNVLDPALALYGSWIVISSGYRSPKLNAHPKIKGSPTSQHSLMEAADLQAKDIDKLYSIIRDNLEFDQLIYETKDSNGCLVKWVHVSYRKGKNRNQILKLHNGKKV